MLAGAHKKFYRVQHAETYLLDLKVQYKHKMKLSLGMVSKHIFLYLCLPDYKRRVNTFVNEKLLIIDNFSKIYFLKTKKSKVKKGKILSKHG